MKELEQRILNEGKILEGGIVKIDGFLNHRIDAALMGRMAKEFENYFDLSKVNLTITSAASGIPVATVCSYVWGLPMLYSKKCKSLNIDDNQYCSQVESYTSKKTVTQIVSKEWLNSDHHVLIIDDFIANGSATIGLIDIVKQSGASIEGIGICVEKGFQPGGDRVRKLGYPYKSLVIIDKAEPDNIVFRKQD